LFLQLLYVAFDTVSAVKAKKKLNNLLKINNVFLELKKGGQVRNEKPTTNINTSTICFYSLFLSGTR
jgi:hypothetical protein